jgi:hypothetical protein
MIGQKSSQMASCLAFETSFQTFDLGSIRMYLPSPEPSVLSINNNDV